MRHPYFKHIPNSSYTHHQKSIVIDYGSKDIMVLLPVILIFVCIHGAHSI